MGTRSALLSTASFLLALICIGDITHASKQHIADPVIAQNGLSINKILFSLEESISPNGLVYGSNVIFLKPTKLVSEYTGEKIANDPEEIKKLARDGTFVVYLGFKRPNGCKQEHSHLRVFADEKGEKTFSMIRLRKGATEVFLLAGHNMGVYVDEGDQYLIFTSDLKDFDETNKWISAKEEIGTGQNLMPTLLEKLAKNRPKHVDSILFTISTVKRAHNVSMLATVLQSPSYRWWFAHDSHNNSGMAKVKSLILPEEYVGLLIPACYESLNTRTFNFNVIFGKNKMIKFTEKSIELVFGSGYWRAEFIGKRIEWSSKNLDNFPFIITIKHNDKELLLSSSSHTAKLGKSNDIYRIKILSKLAYKDHPTLKVKNSAMFHNYLEKEFLFDKNGLEFRTMRKAI